ncbi:MarR family transcriptional regulator [Arthrobacter sp. Soc17.1.1.1]|uniref:MarR family winged helix-turn-helix transcriptional regulator n=1 Tax=Arthrobacter sp. Soc17.1.1.1 TaxID=3121277 RepID=UPI002FE4CF67
MGPGNHSGDDDALLHGRQDIAGADGPVGIVSLEEWSTSRLLSTAARLWEREIAEDLHAVQLSPSSLTALQALSESGTTNQVGLARRVHITAQSLGRTLKALEGLGYVKRSFRTAGQRDIMISLTRAGGRALTALHRETPLGEGTDLSAIEPARGMPIAALRKDLVELLGHITPRTGTS